MCLCICVSIARDRRNRERTHQNSPDQDGRAAGDVENNDSMGLELLQTAPVPYKLTGSHLPPKSQQMDGHRYPESAYVR